MDGVRKRVRTNNTRQELLPSAGNQDEPYRAYRHDRKGGDTKVPKRMVDLDPYKVNIPKLPTEDRQSLALEQQIARVEILMLKGIRQRGQLKELLGIPTMGAVDSMIRKVHARWEITANERNIVKHRGEAILKLELIEAELWLQIQNSDDVRAKIVAAKTLLEVMDRKLPLLGLSGKTLEALDTTNYSKSHNAKVGKQRLMQEMAERFISLLSSTDNVPDTDTDTESVA